MGGFFRQSCENSMFSHCSFLITRSSRASHGVYVKFREVIENPSVIIRERKKNEIKILSAKSFLRPEVLLGLEMKRKDVHTPGK